MSRESQKLQQAVHNGFKRLENFRAARLMFLRSYVGQYYDQDHGEVGVEPLNLIFNAISVYVPSLVMSFPKHVVVSQHMAFREYGELLGLALDQNGKAVGLRNTLRKWIVDAIFTLGILKTGLADSGSVIEFGVEEIDPGTIYTELVSFEDLTFDPTTMDIAKGAFVGHRLRGVSRAQLLDSGLYNNELIERLPRSGTDIRGGARELSRGRLSHEEISRLDDEVDITEVWLRESHALLALPGANVVADDFLRVSDYYGPNVGPYTFLSLTPPVPDNPLGVPAVGIWHDLHTLGNRMAKKIVDQAMRQKDILGYRRAAADDAQEIVDSRDGEAVAMEDPQGAKMYSYGGQQRSNEACMSQLQMWFNLMSGNTETLGGMRSDAPSATQANILQANQSIRIEDLKDIIYVATGEESARRAWYIHTDPLIQVPLIRRQKTAAQYDPMTGQMTSPAQMVDQQVYLTPEAREGEFLAYEFSIEQKSMSRLDPAMRLQRAMEFAIKVLPAAAVAAQTCMAMGVMFSFQRFVVRLAKEAGIEWMDEVFYDPDFQLQMAMQMMQFPDIQRSQGQLRQGAGAGAGAGIRQNGQPGNVAQVKPPSDARAAQVGANQGQDDLNVRPTY